MSYTRVIPVLLFDNGAIWRSQEFARHYRLGDPIMQLERYKVWDVDEIVYIDMHRTKGGKRLLDYLPEIARNCFAPLATGGGIRTIEELVHRVEKIAARLTEGLSNLNGVTTPAIRSGCTHNYYMWSVKIGAAELGTSREAFSKALAAEGFPNASGYVKPIYWLPMFQKRVAIGNQGFPFTLRDRHYPTGLCPVVERMHNKELLQYQPVSWAVDDEQVEMMIEAFRKVHGKVESIPA